MLIASVWIVGSVVGANLILTVLWFIVFAILLNRSDFRDPITAQDVGLQPLTSLPGRGNLGT